MGTEDNHYDKERGRALATLRGILVSSLSRENLPLDLGDSLSPTSPPVPPARRRRRVTFLDGGATEVHCDDLENAGAAPVDPSQKQTSRPSSAKQGKENAAVTQKDREERLRLLKERQNEDRQRKLEELKQQALSAQKFREQKEEERRKRMEELRLRDTDRRHQVEERKRQIWEAERDRREAILRKNQEREARIESKRKNERSSIVFAFGSSTPRMLEPADTGGSSYWATRRATSTSNVMMLSMTAPPGPLTRRSSERELDGSKKRATSAGGINRSKGDDGRMSSSIYEVFQWNSPPSKSPPCISSPLSLVDNTSPSLSQQSVQQGDLSQIKNKTFGDEGDGTSNIMTPAAVAAARAAARRKTDLMPTIPSPRDRDLTPGRPQSSRTMRSPGRAYSMSRLDILARPRKRTLQPPSPATPDPNLSRSMTSLAHQQPTTLRRANTSRSMSQLSAPVPPPRPTRAERLRRKAREAASRSQSLEQTPTSPGMRSGEATPSRPQSAMSQHSVSSAIGMTTSCTSANIRTRPVAAPRRPRPYSIAVTGISSSSPSDSPRQSLSSEHRAATAAAAGTRSSGNDKPPLPKVHTTKKPLSAKPDVSKKPTDKIKSAKSSTASTPKATPLQSPGVEVAPPTLSDETLSVTTVTSVTTTGNDTHAETVTVAVSEITSELVASQKIENKPATVTETVKPAEDKHQPHQVVIDKQPTKQDNEFITPSHQLQQLEQSQEDVSTELPEGDMTASMIARTRITTEEEAKAALAERRRLAREQAEREAELERQRLEAERLAEEERLRLEEEEQRRAEEEQLRLLEEARLAEEQRLQLAIEETQRRDEEEKKRREEEEKLRKEKEEAEKKAKEEAEKLRQEMEIKLKKEEEDRQARRKRVEAIMLRTRGKGQTPTNTPTKEDGEEQDESPGEYTKNENKNMNIQEEFLHSERNHSAAVTSDPIIQQPPPSSNPFLDSINTQKHNGHRNGVDNETVEQNNVTNNLLDFSSFETVNVNNVNVAQPSVGEILQPLAADNMPNTPTNGKLSNEDNLNFNSQPFIAFQDNKKQDSNTVNDLLS